MTNEEKNRQVAEWLGIPWHTLTEQGPGRPPICSCNGRETIQSQYHLDQNPDFTTDSGKVELLREMMKRDDWEEFYMYVGCQRLLPYGFPPVLIIDTSGLLLNAAWEWLKEREK